MPRRSPLVLGLIASLALALAACDDSNDANPTPTPEGPSIRFGAPADCRTNPFCLPGLAREYGFDLSASYSAIAPGAPMEGALRDGAIDVGVFFSTDPVVGSNGWVTLEDDKGMAGADNVIAILKDATLPVIGDQGTSLIEQVHAELTSDELKALVGATQIAGLDLAETAATWVDNNITVEPILVSRPIVVATGSFAETRIVSALYVAALTKAGVPTVVEEIEGFRDVTINELVFGDIDISPEFAASSLRFVSGYGSLATGDVDEVTDRLRQYLRVRDLAVLDPSPAVSINTFVVTPETSQRLGLTRISDLAQYAETGVDVPEGPDVPPDQLPGSGADDLGVGSSGEDVVRLQLQLTALGYDPGPANGEFGEETRRAVVAFQTNNGLRPDGVVGPATADAITEAIADDLANANATPTPPPPVPTNTPRPIPTSPPGGSLDSPVLYLTFDDGPSQFTPLILDLLARYDAKATFYALGQNINANSQIAARAVAEGHAVENHTWDHADLAGLDQASFNRNVLPANDAITGLPAALPTCLRPPYGSTDGNTRGFAAEISLSVELWDVDTQDWRQPGADVIAQHVIDYAYPGAVVLMHDGGGNREQTVAALEMILEHFSGLGYRFLASC